MNKKVLLLVISSTFLNSIAQILFKVVANTLKINTTNLFTIILSILSNIPLITSLAIYFISAMLLITALKHADLSLVYPIIATGFIWVAILSFFIFNEAFTLGKIIGIPIIITGVILLTTSG